MWAAIGSGTPPTNIIYNYPIPAVGVNGGKRVIQNAFTPASCANTSWAPPLTSLTGWEEGFGWKPNVGGYIYAEWSVVKAKIKIPAPPISFCIVDKLPDFVSYASATNGGVSDSAPRTVTWNVGTLNIGQKGQVAVTVKLDPAFEAGTTTLTNEATISTTTPVSWIPPTTRPPTPPTCLPRSN